jgi:hypothetical protein
MTETNFRALCAIAVELWDADCDMESVISQMRILLSQPEPVPLTRPECFDFAMDFVGDPEETEVRRYVEALEARVTQAQPEPGAKELIAELVRLARRQHYSCEDPWYSCPKSPDGCANDSEGDECNCGADKHNDAIEQIAAKLESVNLVSKEAR